MTPEQWEKVGQIYQSALELKTEDRAAYLNQACAGDHSLRIEVESLLAVDGRAEDFLAEGAMSDAAKMLAQEKALSLIGKKLGPYQALALIGAGGMGEVYRARDARLSRDVAIKVLPASFARDADRLRRFEQEARAAGMLSHPNILTIYDIGDYEGAPYLVAELLEGEDLRAQLKQGAIPQRKALDYAQQIARGLAAAHERGIVHRDLKPENLFITKDGRVKILDFGLAKLKPQPNATIESQAATQGRFTEPGMVMGTVGYMAPEQARGEEADHRADIFAFGAILYEMLTGQRAFHGESAVETMNAILKEEPAEASEAGRQNAPALSRVMRRCLEKKPEQRFQSARDLAFNLEMLSGLSGVMSVAVPVVNRDKIRERFVWLAVAVVLLLAASGFAIAYFRREPNNIAVTRFQVALPEKTTFIPNIEIASMSISPDGRCLAFVAISEGQRSLWLRRLDAVAAQALPGTAEAASPFWSPDSRFIAFFAEGKLKKVAAAGGGPQTICDLPANASSGAWGGAGDILIGGSSANFKGIYRVSEIGGAVRPLLKVDQPLGYWLKFLPDGQRFLYFSLGKDKQKGIYVGSLKSAESSLLLPSNSRGEYAPPGYLLFAREGSLVAQKFDANNLRLTGAPFTVLEQVASFDPTGWAEFSVSGNDVLAYHTYTPASFSWFDRSGRQSGAVIAPGLYDTHRLSPDGRRIAFALKNTRVGRADLWISELTRDTSTRITFNPTDHGDPIWSPDGRRLAFFSFHGVGKSTLALKDVNDAGEGEYLLPDVGIQTPSDWSLDGQFIAYTEEQNYSDPLTGKNLWFLPLFGDRKPIPFLCTRFNESGARFSPNRRWVAYVSDESGRQEVYVRAFDGSGEKTRISTNGGSRPCWRRDGAELFYLAGDNQLMAASVKMGATFEAGAPVALFRIDSPGWQIGGNAFDVTPDGQRFLIQTGVPGAQSLPFTVVTHWTADLKR